MLAGLIRPDEEPEVARVLNAAALTYVAATLTSVLTVAVLPVPGRGVQPAVNAGGRSRQGGDRPRVRTHGAEPTSSR